MMIVKLSYSIYYHV